MKLGKDLSLELRLITRIVFCGALLTRMECLEGTPAFIVLFCCIGSAVGAVNVLSSRPESLESIALLTSFLAKNTLVSRDVWSRSHQSKPVRKVHKGPHILL